MPLVPLLFPLYYFSPTFHESKHTHTHTHTHTLLTHVHIKTQGLLFNLLSNIRKLYGFDLSGNISEQISQTLFLSLGFKHCLVSEYNYSLGISTIGQHSNLWWPCCGLHFLERKAYILKHLSGWKEHKEKKIEEKYLWICSELLLLYLFIFLSYLSFLWEMNKNKS